MARLALMLLPVLALACQITPARSESTGFHHADLDQLLQRHVVPVRQGLATEVDYRGLSGNRDRLQAYLDSLSAVDQRDFDSWPTPDQLAFLINAYNASALSLVLTGYPDIDSIRDLGRWLRPVWRRKFIFLLGEMRSLDGIEHGLIRGSGRYPDPRVHFAVNCASVGCPALRAEAYAGHRLEQQLEQQVTLFLRDRHRNYRRGDSLRLSPIFKWYREDFEQGWRNADSLTDFLVRYADALELSAGDVGELRSGGLRIAWSDYDWRLNDRHH